MTRHNPIRAIENPLDHARAGYGADRVGGRKIALFSGPSTSRKNRRPDRGRSGIFEVHACEIELTFANAMH
jgi:hypothetical protein